MRDHANRMTGFYAALLRLFPRDFREEFGEEMQAVFEDVIREAGQAGTASLIAALVREMFGVAVSLPGEYRRLFRRGGIPMDANETSESMTGSTPREALWAALPFAAFGICRMLSELLPPPYYSIPFMLMLIFSLAGLYIGAVSGFPNWSYSYIGWAGTLTLLWAMFRVSENPWLAQILNCIGPVIFLVILAIPAVRQHSLEPIRKLFRGIWRDWTSLTLALFCFAGYVLLIYDENHHPYLLAFMAASTLTICAGIWFFMRSRSTGSRVLTLIATFLVSLALVSISDSTWDAAAYYNLPPAGPQPWHRGVLGVVQMAAVWAAMMFWPALIGLIRKLTLPRST